MLLRFEKNDFLAFHLHPNYSGKVVFFQLKIASFVILQRFIAAAYNSHDA